MPRPALAAAALLLAAASAPAPEPLRFELRPRDGATAQLRIHRDRHGNWSQSIRLDEASGLDRAALGRGGPLAFHLVRPAGILACAGRAHDRRADGTCTVAADRRFADALAAQGIGTPAEDETLQLAMSGVTLDVADALHAAGWGRPTIDQLVQLGIFHVTAAGIRNLAAAGCRGGAVDALVKFAIFKVTPQYVTQMRAAGVTDLSNEALVQLRIFSVTPDDARAFAGPVAPSAQQLVKRKIFQVQPRGASARG